MSTHFRLFRTVSFLLPLTGLLAVSLSKAEVNDLSLVFARFQGPDPNMYPVQDIFRMWLEDIYEEYCWIEVTSIPESVPFDNIDPFTGDSAGIAMGREAGADLFVWGAYKVKDDGTVPAFLAHQFPMFLELPLEASMSYAMFADDRAFSVDDFRDPGPPSDLFRFQAYMILSDYYLVSDQEMSLEFTELAGQYIHTAEDYEVSGYHLNRAMGLLHVDRLQEAYEEIELARESCPFQSDVLEEVRTGIEVAMSEAGIVPPSLRSNDGIPSTAEECYQLAVTYDRAGRYDEALVMYDAAIERANTDEMLASLYLDRALCNSFRNDYEAALEDAEISVQYDSLNPMAQTRLGEAYYDLYRYEEALPHLNTAVELSEPGSFNHSYAVRARAMCNIEMGNVEQAVADFEAFSLTELMTPFYMEIYGVGLYMFGDYQKAAEYITSAIQGGSETANGYMYRSFAHGSLGEVDRALSDMNTAIQMQQDPVGRANLYFERSTIYIMMGDYESALEDLDECLSMLPESANGYCQRGYVNAMIARLPEAKADMETALGLPEENWTHAQIREYIDEIGAAMQ